MLLLSILLLPVVLGAGRERHFRRYVVKINENNTLTNVEEKIQDEYFFSAMSESEAAEYDKYFFELNLSNLGLENIDPNAFDDVTEIKGLNLTNNWLTTLPKYVFSKLPNLQHLSLAKNNISSLDSVFIGLNSLRSLDLSNNHFEHIGAGYLYGLNKDVNILTEGNVLSNISTLIFGRPDNPPEATIRENKTEDTRSLTNIPTDNSSVNEVCTENYWIEKIRVNDQYASTRIVNCTVVGINQTDLRLTLSHYGTRYNLTNILQDLPDNIVGLDLSHTPIYVLESEPIENLHLRHLTLDDGDIHWLGDNVFAKTNLSVLSLSHNGLEDIKFAKTLPTSLEEIRLNNNRISAIPSDSFSRLKNLVKLDLSHNSLWKIEPGSFRNLGALRELNLYDNHIVIYKGIFAGFESIEYLNIGLNRLRETENILFAMPETLQTVILDSNRIERLEVGSFVGVPKRKLSLRENNIHSFEEGSFDLPSLEELDLSGNALTRLNQLSFYGLASLKQLSLARTGITTLNNGDLEFLHKLEILDLSDNPIKSLGRGALRGMVMSERGVVLLSNVRIEGIDGSFSDY